MAEKEVKEKPLDKMTAKELREVAKDTEKISGVHGMNKAELIAAIKESRGIVEAKKKTASASVRDIKIKIKALKADRNAAIDSKDKEKAAICRRRISRLKKRARRAA